MQNLYRGPFISQYNNIVWISHLSQYKNIVFISRKNIGHFFPGLRRIITFHFSFLLSEHAASKSPLGGVLLPTLCDLLEEEGVQNMEATLLLNRLSDQVTKKNYKSRGSQQTPRPYLLSRLTKQVFPFAKKKKGI